MVQVQCNTLKSADSSSKVSAASCSTRCAWRSCSLPYRCIKVRVPLLQLLAHLQVSCIINKNYHIHFARQRLHQIRADSRGALAAAPPPRATASPHRLAYSRHLLPMAVRPAATPAAVRCSSQGAGARYIHGSQPTAQPMTTGCQIFSISGKSVQ